MIWNFEKKGTQFQAAIEREYGEGFPCTAQLNIYEDESLFVRAAIPNLEKQAITFMPRRFAGMKVNGFSVDNSMLKEMSEALEQEQKNIERENSKYVQKELEGLNNPGIQLKIFSGYGIHKSFRCDGLSHKAISELVRRYDIKKENVERYFSDREEIDEYMRADFARKIVFTLNEYLQKLQEEQEQEEQEKKKSEEKAQDLLQEIEGTEDYSTIVKEARKLKEDDAKDVLAKVAEKTGKEQYLQTLAMWDGDMSNARGEFGEECGLITEYEAVRPDGTTKIRRDASY